MLVLFRHREEGDGIQGWRVGRWHSYWNPLLGGGSSFVGGMQMNNPISLEARGLGHSIVATVLFWALYFSFNWMWQ